MIFAVLCTRNARTCHTKKTKRMLRLMSCNHTQTTATCRLRLTAKTLTATECHTRTVTFQYSTPKSR